MIEAGLVFNPHCARPCDKQFGIKSFKHNIKEDQADASMEAQAQGQSQPAGSIQGPAAASSTAQTAQNTTTRPGA